MIRIKNKKFVIARNYERIVHGGRGDYIEINAKDIISSNIFIPQKQLWRIDDPIVKYIEYRSKVGNVKIYYQKRLVDYADYLVGYYYVSPTEVDIV